MNLKRQEKNGIYKHFTSAQAALPPGKCLGWYLHTFQQCPVGPAAFPQWGYESPSSLLYTQVVS